MSGSFACRDAGRAYELVLDEAGAVIDGQPSTWLDVDDVVYDGHSLGFVLADGSTAWARGLGARFDECGRRVRELRGAARRPALTQTAQAVVEAFESRSVEADAVRVADVLVFPHLLTIEPRGGASTVVPLPLIREVHRDGHVFRLTLRGLPEVVIGGLGARTDEFADVLGRCREANSDATKAAYAALSPDLGSVTSADGWAASAGELATSWTALLETWRQQDRGPQLDVLAQIVGEQGLRLGLWTEGGTASLPFALACKPGASGYRVAVEAVAADDRATFVFDTPDVDALNAALIITAFRRDAIALPDSDLGRWAPAVRTQPIVAWARQHVVARVVHDGAWESNVRAALA